MNHVRFLLGGDCAITVEFGNEIRPEINHKIRALSFSLAKSGISGVRELVPTYRSLMIHYDPEILSYSTLVHHLEVLLQGLEEVALPPSTVLEIPVLYGGEGGPDLDFVGSYNGKSAQEVIDLHSSAEYLIYMLGFTPGFSYLGGLSDEIATPRLETPRVKIPAGSVGIAGSQTGIYPIDSPGGWQLIGRTPVKLYDPHRAVPILLQAGDYIHFTPIDQDEFDRITQLEAQSGYICGRYSKEVTL
ncbi:MAG: 5-oxoprolinase subunit PxpB [Eubacteriales bacterium]